MGIVTIVTAFLILILVVCCFAYVRQKQLGAKTNLQSLPTRKASPSKSAPSRFSHQGKNQTTQSASHDSELEARLIRKLLTKCMGDEAKAKRLIDYEKRKNPRASRAECIQAAIESWERDLR